MAKKIVIAAVIVCLVLASGALAAAWVVNSDRFRDWLVDRVNRTIAGRIAVGGHHLSVLQGRLQVSAVQVFGPDQAELVTMDNCEVVLSLAGLLAREIGLIHVVIDGLRLNLLLDDRQQLNLADAFAGSGPDQESQGNEPSIWRVRVDNFRLRDGGIHFQQPSRGLDVRAAPVAINGRMDMGGPTGKLALDIGTLSFKMNDLNQTVRDLAIQAVYQSGQARPWQVTIHAPDWHVVAGARVHLDGSRTELDAAIEAGLELAAVYPWLEPWLESAVDLQGQLQFKLEVNGPVADPAARLELALKQAAARGVEVTQLDVRAALAQRRISLDKFSGQGPWGRLAVQGELDLQSMFARDLFTPTGGLDSLVYDLHLAGEALQPGLLPDLPLGWIGIWQGKVHAKGRGFPGLAINQGSGEADLTVAGIRLLPGAAPVDGSIRTSTGWDGSVLDVQSVQVRIPAQELNADGRIDLGAKTLQAAGTLVSERIEALGRALGIVLPQGAAQVKLTASGPLSRPQVSATMLAQQVRLDAITFGRVLASAELDSNLNLRFPRLALENQGSYLQGSGHLALAAKDLPVGLELNFDPLDPADFLVLNPALQTALSGHLSVSGTLQNPAGRLTLDASPIAWQSYQAQVKGAAQWAAGRLQVSGLQLFKNRSRIDLKGDIRFQDPKSGRWRRDPLVNLSTAADAVQLADFFPEFKGALVASATLSGPISRPVGRFSLQARELDLKYQDVSQVAAAGRFQDRVLHVDQLTIDLLPDQSIHGKGFYNLNQAFDFQLTADDLDLARIRALQAESPLSGRLDLAVRGKGRVSKPDLSAELTVRNPVFKDQPLQDFHLQARLLDTKFTVDGRMNFDLQVEGDVSKGDFSLQAIFAEADLAPWLTLLAGDSWQGRLSGDVAAHGNWQDWRRIQADVNLREMQVSFKGRSLVAIPTLNVHLREGRIQLPQARLRILDVGYLDVNALRDASGELAAGAQGRIPVAAFAPFLEDPDDADGELVIEAGARGTLEKINWQVDLRLDQVSYVLPYLSQTVHDLNGRIQVTPEQVKIDGLAAKIDDGGFALSGRLELEGLRPTQGALTLEIDALPLQVPETADLLLNGKLTLQGGTQRALLEGNLVLLEGMYYKDLKLDLWSMLTEPRRGKPVPRTGQGPAWMQNIGLDVSLNYRHPFMADNNLARLEIAPDLQLTGTMARPVLSGRATVTEGEVMLRGKKFPITRGVVDFINPNRIEPSLDIVSQTRIRTWQVTLSISGTPDQLEVKLVSDPPESENDILSLILFGRTNSEIAGGTGGATTQQMLAGLLASALGDDVKKTTRVDILEVETGAQRETDSADRIQVTVGKKLTERMTIKYEVETNNGEMIQRAVSEYRFIEQLLASGFQDNKGRYGGELLFRLEFR